MTTLVKRKLYRYIIDMIRIIILILIFAICTPAWGTIYVYKRLTLLEEQHNKRMIRQHPNIWEFWEEVINHPKFKKLDETHKRNVIVGFFIYLLPKSHQTDKTLQRMLIEVLKNS